ncbi:MULTISPECIES: hypothetical protein [unclassified Mesorhizobium]|uniref:hypothetical protein n=1 Tax=unclassified Mesorhizobium TaxID=325217 RepID=UPI0015E466D1|nr:MULTISPECIES: hypothetical protein [unclassified Mesorhizobium]MCA0027381.1 hypothetical protein [Mesorhizobium sp. B263B1A]
MATGKEFARDVAARSAARERELLEANNRYQQEARDARAALNGAFQERVAPFMLACFGVEIAGDGIERNHRFLEESLELVQALGCTASEAHQLVDYVFNRPVGEPNQEAGGVAVTFAALCNAHGINGAIAAENELTRCWSKIDKIRAKWAAKPKHGPLPEHVAGVDIPRLPVGTPVVKVLGYPYPGEVRAAFTTTSGNERFVVEATGPDYGGMLHIFSGDQLRALPEGGEANA